MKSAKYLYPILSLFALIFSLLPVSGATPKREMRSVWLTGYVNIDWPSRQGTDAATVERQKRELVDYIDACSRSGFTGICLQVRPMADALYMSTLEPSSQYLSGQRGAAATWDALAYAVDQAHRRGLECYAWVNPLRQNRGGAPRTTAQDKKWQADGWLINYCAPDKNGRKTAANDYTAFNPALPEVRRHIVDVIRDIYSRYRIDGIIFDDYFYPNKMPTTVEAPDYTLFEAQTGGRHATDAEGLKKDFGDWRRGNINKMIAEVYAAIGAERPDIRFGVSPAGVAFKGLAEQPTLTDMPAPVEGTTDWQYDDIFSDPVAWMVEGSVDFISPQLYWFSLPGSNSYTKAAPYNELCRWWSSLAAATGRHFYPSLASYRLEKGHNDVCHWHDIECQIERARSEAADDAPGQIFYSTKYINGPECSGLGDYLAGKVYATRALMPVATWKEHAAPEAPSAVERKGHVLDWDNGRPVPKGCMPLERYTVYAVPTAVSLTEALDEGGDGLDARWLLGVVYDRRYELPADRRSGYWYALCAYDGYGRESSPVLIGYEGGF